MKRQILTFSWGIVNSLQSHACNTIFDSKKIYAEQISQECPKSCAEGHCIADTLLSIHMLQGSLVLFSLLTQRAQMQFSINMMNGS